MTWALGMHGGGQQRHRPSAGVSLQPHGARGHPSLGLAAQPSGMSQFPLGLCKAPRPRTKAPNPPPLDPPPALLTAFLPHPCSLLALLWHHTLAVLSAAAGQQVPSTQRYKKLHCALKVLVGDRGRVSLAGTGVWAPANSILLPRAWSCASTLRAAGCRWRPSTLQPSWYGVLGMAGSPGLPLGALQGGCPQAAGPSVCLTITFCPPRSRWRPTWPSAPPPAANSSRNTLATGSSSR